jgi:hypothetical protein
MSVHIHNAPTRYTQQFAFQRARRHVGYRVCARAGVRLNVDIPAGCTGTVAFVAAMQDGGVWIVVAWDFLVARLLWYTEDTFLEGVSILGSPVVAPVASRKRVREFTLVSAFERLGRPVYVVRAPTARTDFGATGIVRCVVADDHRVMLAVSWTDPTARPDETWFSRSDYNFYLSEELPT